LIVSVTYFPSYLYVFNFVSTEILLKDLLYYEEATEDFLGHNIIDTKKLDQMYVTTYQIHVLSSFVSLIRGVTSIRSPIQYTLFRTHVSIYRGKILEHVRVCQTKSYSFAEYPLLRDFLLSIRGDIQVEELDQLSLNREPSSINFEIPRTASQGQFFFHSLR
jgi:hypothetical protein